MNSEIAGVTNSVAEADLPLAAKIDVAKEGIDALRRDLKNCEQQLADIAKRVEDGEEVTSELDSIQNDLTKLRTKIEGKITLMTGYIAGMEKVLL